MRILFISDNLKAPTGFGSQTDMVARRLVTRGHEVGVVGGTHLVSSDLPQGLTEFNSKDLRPDDLDQIAENYRPDVCVIFNHLQLMHKISFCKGIANNVPTFYWMAWEGSSLPPEASNMMYYIPGSSVVHITPEAQTMWDKLTPNSCFIPHGVSSLDFYSDTSKVSELRDKWSSKLNTPIMNDSLLLLNVDRNDVRKRWDLTLDLVNRVCDHPDMKGRKVQLLAHTHPTENKQKKVGGIDLAKAIEMYGLRGKVIMTNMDSSLNFMSRSEVAELYRMSDIHISTTTGEGFGIPAIEAMASEIPSVVPEHTGLKYVMQNQFGLTPTTSRFILADTLWHMPDVAAMSEKVVDLARNKDLYETSASTALSKAHSTFDIEDVVDQWESLLAEAHSEKYEGGYNHRWGHSNTMITKRSLHSVAKVLPTLVPEPTVFEAGSGSGMFIDFCRAEGIQIQGQEPDLNFIRRGTSQAQALIRHSPYASTLPPADIFVMTDILDFLQDSSDDPESTDLLDEYFNRLENYFWVVARFESSNRWDLPMVHPTLAKQLISRTHTRRVDLEVMIQTKLPNFSHQIWMKTDGGMAEDAVPPELERTFNVTS